MSHRALAAASVALGLVLLADRATASPIAFTATFTIELFQDPDDGPEPLAGGPIVLGGAGIADASGAAFTLPVGAIGGSFATGPEAMGTGYPIVTQLGALANLPGSFAPSGGDVVGTMGMSGAWQFGLFGPPAVLFVNLPIGPLGIGGSETTSGSPPYQMDGGPWTTGTVSVTGFGVGTVSATGYDARDPFGIGVIELVTPIKIDNPGFPSFAEPSGYATLTLTFVPEPGTAILLGVGLVAIAGRARR